MVAIALTAGVVLGMTIERYGPGHGGARRLHFAEPAGASAIACMHQPTPSVPIIIDAETVPEPAPARPRLRHVTPEDHAIQLLAWLQDGGLTGDVRAKDVEAIYGEMCLEAQDAMLPWQRLSPVFGALIGETKKFYPWVVAADGQRHRWRHYSIPQPGSAGRSRPARAHASRSVPTLGAMTSNLARAA